MLSIYKYIRPFFGEASFGTATIVNPAKFQRDWITGCINFAESLHLVDQMGDKTLIERPDESLTYRADTKSVFCRPHFLN